MCHFLFTSKAKCTSVSQLLQPMVKKGHDTIIKESKKNENISVREKETKRIKLGQKNKPLRQWVLYEFLSRMDEDNPMRKFGWGAGGSVINKLILVHGAAAGLQGLCRQA